MDEKTEDQERPEWVGKVFTYEPKKAKKARRAQERKAQEGERRFPVKVRGPMRADRVLRLLKHIEANRRIVVVLLPEKGSRTSLMRARAKPGAPARASRAGA